MFSPEIQAKRAELRRAYAAMDDYGNGQWEQATRGMRWWRKIGVQLDETDEFGTLNAAVAEAEKAVPWWQRLDLRWRRSA